MTLHTVPSGTLTNCDYLVTGLKVTNHMLMNSLSIPSWMRALVPPYVPLWERQYHSYSTKEPSTHRRIFGCRDRPIVPASAEHLPDGLARVGFSPSKCRIKRVDEERFAISIYWSRPGNDDTDSRIERALLYRAFFREIQLQHSWSVYAKELRDNDGTRVIAVNFSTPQTILPSRRTYEIMVEGHQLVHQLRSARTLYD